MKLAMRSRQTKKKSPPKSVATLAAASGVPHLGGGTHAAVPASTAAARGSVQNTFTDAIVLSGFTDSNHFQILIGEYLAAVSASERQRIEAAADVARAHVRALPAAQLS